MATLINAHLLEKTFAARPLFKGLTFSIESGDRIGLIGPNGAGKSTLVRILASHIKADDGTLSFQRGLRVGLLEQVPKFSAGATLWSSIMEGAHDPHDWECMQVGQEMTSRLGLDKFPEDTPIANLSGGWQKRVALARELTKKPELLLLDEPTNHLDIETILWLENFLARSAFATLIVTHDRLFLQKVSNRILELDPRHPGGLLSVAGDYTDYLEVREQLINAQERREIILKNTLRRETEWLRRGAKARTTKQQARIERHGELKDEVSELTTRNQNRVSRIQFQGSEKNPKKLLEAKNISKSFGARTLFKDFSTILGPGVRLGLLGTNGSGKSTLIRVLLKQEPVSTGEVTHSENLSVAYFDQKREALDPEVTVLRTICPQGDHVHYRGTYVHIRGYLDRFLFSPMQMDMPVGRLSGGEQSRVLIAKLMLTTANLLVLDEPTNDLDMATLGVLEECLDDFPGSVILVTHDRYFLDSVATQIIAFPPEPSDGQLISFTGIEQWENWIQTRPKDGDKKQKTNTATVQDTTPASGKKKKLSFKEQNELATMEVTIQKAEAKLEALTAESALPENAANSVALGKLTKAMAEVQADIDRLYARWAELEKN